MEIGLVAGAAAFVGHCYPVWLKFVGGKGVATFFGVLFAGAWPLGVMAGVTWIAVATMFGYSSLGSLSAAAIAPIAALVAGFDLPVVAFTLVLAGLIFWRHRANIVRLRAGTEPRIGGKKAKAQSDGAPMSETPAEPAPGATSEKSAAADTHSA
jgi:glycerol-3-phosphate acyltransferase PlsY